MGETSTILACAYVRCVVPPPTFQCYSMVLAPSPCSTSRSFPCTSLAARLFTKSNRVLCGFVFLPLCFGYLYSTREWNHPGIVFLFRPPYFPWHRPLHLPPRTLESHNFFVLSVWPRLLFPVQRPLPSHCAPILSPSISLCLGVFLALPDVCTVEMESSPNCSSWSCGGNSGLKLPTSNWFLRLESSDPSL